jgi:hypothetical protein
VPNGVLKQGDNTLQQIPEEEAQINAELGNPTTSTSSSS